MTSSSFAYSAARLVLHDVNLRIAPGGRARRVRGRTVPASPRVGEADHVVDPHRGTRPTRGGRLHSLRPPARPAPERSVRRQPCATTSPSQRRTRSDAEVWGGAVERAVLGLREVVSGPSTDPPCTSAASRCPRAERQLIALARAFHAQPRALVLARIRSPVETEARVDIRVPQRPIAHRLMIAMECRSVDDGRSPQTGHTTSWSLSRGCAGRGHRRWRSLPVASDVAVWPRRRPRVCAS